MVNYDRQEFFVSPATFPDPPVETRLVTIGADGNHVHSGLSTGAIAGIAVGAAALMLIIAAVFFWRWRKNRKVQKLRSELTSRASIGGTTIQEEDTHHNMEFFKPVGGAEEEIKPELDGHSAIPAGFVQYGRHELASNGSFRRTSQQSGLSRATVSPIDQRMPGHARNLSYGSSNGQPSPNPGDSPLPGQWSPPSRPSPGTDMGEFRHTSGGQWYFELPSNPRSPQVVQPEEDEIRRSSVAQIEPVEARADPRSPVDRAEPEPEPEPNPR